MNKLSVTISLALTASCLLVMTTTAAAHPFHASIAEAEFNAKTNKIEVAMRLHPVDLEAVLRQIEGKPVDLDKTKNIDQLIVSYLAANFRIIETGTAFEKAEKVEAATKSKADRKALKLHWVGKEIARKWAWVYFEFDIPSRRENYVIANTVFFDRLDDQVNTVNFRDGERRWSKHFTIERTETGLLAPPPENPTANK
jgi:hypothetical protein